MKQPAVISSRWDDIVFENRNKDYGAYLIRKIYARHIALSIIIMLTIIGLVFMYPAIVSFFKSDDETTFQGEVKQLTVILDQPPPIIPNQPPPPKMDIPPPVKTVIKFLPPKVTDKQIIEDEIPKMTDIKQKEVAPESKEGEGVVIFPDPVKEVLADNGDANQTFLVVEQPPEYQGGLEAMYKFISKNMQYPSQARRMGIEGNVFVSFVVDADGKISEVSTLKGMGAGCDEEAMRVIKMMPPWKPGKQRGKPVRVRFTLPLKFRLG